MQRYTASDPAERFVPKWNQERIRTRAREMIAGQPDGIRYSELVSRIAAETPETSRNTIRGSVWDLDVRFPAQVIKPDRGVFAPRIDAQDEPVVVEEGAAPAAPVPAAREAEFYDSFADWLRGELEEVTEAFTLGGNAMKSKWGTPDVLGVYRQRRGDLVEFNLEIVTAQIKVDPAQSIVAFGQAAAYRLFSAKTYLVMPNTISPEDKGRLDALSMLYGIGFVLFTLDKAAPDFEIRVRAQRFTPDPYYVNEFAKRLQAHDEKLFHDLFG